MVGRGGLEPPTSRLSGVRSNHLSYRPSGSCNNKIDNARQVTCKASLPKGPVVVQSGGLYKPKARNSEEI